MPTRGTKIKNLGEWRAVVSLNGELAHSRPKNDGEEQGSNVDFTAVL